MTARVPSPLMSPESNEAAKVKVALSELITGAANSKERSPFVIETILRRF